MAEYDDAWPRIGGSKDFRQYTLLQCVKGRMKRYFEREEAVDEGTFNRGDRSSPGVIAARGNTFRAFWRAYKDYYRDEE